MNHSVKRNNSIVEPGLAVIHAYTFIATIYCASFFIIFYFVEKNSFLSIIHLAALLTVITNYLFLIRTKNFKRATNITLATCMLVAISLFITGGWEHTGYLWSFAILPFAFFLSERSIYPKWIAAIFTGCVIVVMLDFLNVINIQYSPVVLLNYFAAMVMFVICIFLSQKATNVYKETLTTEKAREILRSEQKFKILIENSSESISLLNKDFIPVYCSPSAERIT